MSELFRKYSSGTSKLAKTKLNYNYLDFENLYDELNKVYKRDSIKKAYKKKKLISLV